MCERRRILEHYGCVELKWKEFLAVIFGEGMDLLEEVGESSSPARSFGSFGPYDIRNDVYNRLMEGGKEDVVANPEFREQLDAHFNRLPSRFDFP